MAKMYKVEMYVLDINEQYQDLESIINDIENRTDCSFNSFNIKEVEFEWDDNLRINYTSASIDDYREYFKDKTRKCGDGFSCLYPKLSCKDCNMVFID